MFVPAHEIKQDMKTLNLTNQILRKSRRLNKEQRKKYAELGKFCQKCADAEDETPAENSDGKNDNGDNQK